LAVQHDFIEACGGVNVKNVNALLQKYYHPKKRFRAIRQFFGYEIALNRIVILDRVRSIIYELIKLIYTATIIMNIPASIIYAFNGFILSAIATAALAGIAYLGHRLIDRDINCNLTALMHAASYGHLDIVSKLLAIPGIEINKKNGLGLTALMYAAGNGRLDIVTRLLAVPGIDINHADRIGSTAITLAFEQDEADIVALLQANGAVLPEHIRQMGLRINKAQSAHEVSVHVSVSRSAENLLKQYNFTPKQVADEISHLKAWLKTDFPRSTILLARTILWLNSAFSKATNLISRSNAWLKAVFPRTTNLLLRAANLILAAKSSLKRSFPKSSNLLSRGLTGLNIRLHKVASKLAKVATPTGYKIEWVQPAKRCVANLSKLEFTDQRSNITMQQALALVWTGINNPYANGSDKPVLTAQELVDRRLAFLRHLYEIQRGYNLSDAANAQDNGGWDSPTCVSGSFNKLIAALNEMGHKGVQLIFVTRAVIMAHVPALTQQAFDNLSDEHKKRFAQEWEGENSDAVQAECFGLLKVIVDKKLHELYDEFHAMVPNFNQTILDAMDNVQYTDLDKVIEKARIANQKQELAYPAALPAYDQPMAPEPVIFTRCTLRNNAPNNVITMPSEAAFISERRYPSRIRSFTGSYKV
jgi:hypothetical protein